MLVKIIIVLFLIVIVYSLGSALYYLAHERNEADADRVVKALTWRIGLSLLLFVLLFVAYAMGWVNPHGV
ncbi:MAG TPA: twin transmembrane helix small protein [Gammaproteobacteria bacterium]|nr:twin transmembrane helix small protein [Gammaproteobacteria bacterium]